jgi:hypothetical protein
MRSRALSARGRRRPGVLLLAYTQQVVLHACIYPVNAACIGSQSPAITCNKALIRQGLYFFVQGSPHHDHAAGCRLHHWCAAHALWQSRICGMQWLACAVTLPCDRPASILLAYPACNASSSTTLLHAGPSGSFVRDISFVTGADIKSWTEPGSPNSPSRSARTFNIEVCFHFILIDDFTMPRCLHRWRTTRASAFVMCK